MLKTVAGRRPEACWRLGLICVNNANSHEVA